MTTAGWRLFIAVSLHKQPRQLAILAMLLVVGIPWSTCVAQGPRSKAAKADVPAKQEAGKGMPKGYEKIVAVTFPGVAEKTEVDGTLLREVARQALLVAAEQELGVVTLDSSIGEVIPSGNVAPGPFVVTAFATRNQEGSDDSPLYDYNVSITRFNPAGPEFQWTAPKMEAVDHDWVVSFVDHMELLSRTQLVEALEKAGYTKSRVDPDKAKAGVAAKIEDRFDFVTQFGLIRRLHAQLRTEETPELLGELVRAYANIGSLVDYHWSPASKAFKARALIYAQRLVSKYESTPFALAHRAYALALTGRHGDALNDIAAIDDATGMEAPDWLDLIRAYCEFDAATLRAENGPHLELALYLRICATSMDYGMDNARQVSQKFIAANPACCRAMDLLIDSGGFAAKRWVTETAFDSMWPHVHYRLLAIPGLPAPVRAISDKVIRNLPKPAAEYEQRKKLVEGLQAATAVKDSPGPSWAVLADLLRDAAFCQTWRVLDVQDNTLGIDPTPTFQAMKPVVKGHRMENFLSLFIPDHSGTQLKLNSTIDAVGRDSFQAGSFPLVAMLSDVGETEPVRVQQMMRANLDPTYEDALREMIEGQGHPQRQLIDISPQWPASIVDVIHREPEPSLEEYEEEYGNSMIVMRSIGDKHAQLKHWKDAIRCWKKVAEVTKSCADLQALAEAYRQDGQKELWVETLQQALTRPDSGLQHAGIHGQLAGWFIEQEKWDEAAPHAKKAAESYSGWGLWIGAQWAEGAQDWGQADIYMRNLSSRYSDSAKEYLYWCLRNGRGDRSLARRIVERHVGSLPKPLHWNVQAPLVIALVADDDHVAARKLLQEIFLVRKNVPLAIHEALLADEDGDTERRDALFLEIENTATNQASFRELVGCFRGVLNGTNEGQWDPHVMDMLVAKTAHIDASMLYFLAGKFLGQHGQKERSLEFLQTAATSRYGQDYGTHMAMDALQKQNIPLGKPRKHFVPDALNPLIELLDESARQSVAGDLPKATALLTDLLKQRSDFLPALIARSYSYERQDNYAEAIADLEEAIRINPRFFYAHIQLARILSTCEKDEFRNGKKALQLAERAAELGQRDTKAGLEVMASALAECGQFEKAAEAQTRASKQPNPDKSSEERLKLYSASKPYHGKPTSETPWPAQPVWFYRD